MSILMRGTGLCPRCKRRKSHNPINGYCRRCGVEAPKVHQNLYRPLPARPTQADPGSPEKLAVMEQRYKDGEQLHHPLDRRYHSCVVGIILNLERAGDIL